MGTSGRAIQCPLGPQFPKRRKLPETKALHKKAEHNEAQGVWGEMKCEEISQALDAVPQVWSDDQPEDNEDYENDLPNDYFAHFWPLEEENIQEQDNLDEDELHTYVQLVSGTSYRHCRI
ncbi:hypothetical protein DFH28DRAFT_926645 [Melampsora americana]|nr:hypothetical protein DFH28DRAFT_926645 [Melampsora americana]